MVIPSIINSLQTSHPKSERLQMALVAEQPADGKRISGFGARDPRIRFAKQSAGQCLGKIVMKFS